MPTFDGPRVAMRTHLRGIVTPRLVNRVIRAIDEGLKDEKLNLIVIELDSPEETSMSRCDSHNTWLT